MSRPLYFIYVPLAGKFIGPTRFGHGALYDKEHAGLYPEDEIKHVTELVLGQSPRFNIQVATVSEIKAWAGRKGGLKTSPEKARAVRRNGAMNRK